MSKIPLEQIETKPDGGVTFAQLLASDPCSDCTSPCCRMMMLPHKTPQNFMDMDHIRYMLGYPTIQMVVSAEGQWYVVVLDTCRFLDTETNLCTVHGTPRKPQVCINHNQHQCWYKRNFTKETSPDLVRFDSDIFEEILKRVHFDDDGKIVRGLSLDDMRELSKPPAVPLV